MLDSMSQLQESSTNHAYLQILENNKLVAPAALFTLICMMGGLLMGDTTHPMSVPPSMGGGGSTDLREMQVWSGLVL